MRKPAFLVFFFLANFATWRLGERRLSVFAAEPAATEEQVAQEYRRLDHDRDGGVTQDEFLAGVPDNRQKAARHDFQLADFDRDGRLALPEYQALRGFAVPDPWTEQAAAALATWRKILKDADRNEDGRLSSDEWPGQILLDALKPLGEIGFDVWDADRNGQATVDEAQQIIDAAYGVRHPDGTRLRLANGDVVYFSYYRDMDRDRDGVVSAAEFVAVHWMGEERNKAYFAEIDADRDGRLSPREFAQAERLSTHSFDSFRQWDADFDGMVSEEELAKQSPPVQNQRRKLKLGFAPFDEDRDGKFSFREFRLAPVGELYVMADWLKRTDADRDGGIAWSEFRPDGGPLLLGVAWEIFRKYDRNADGRLTVDEYEFPVDGSPRGIADLFRVLDEDASGQLTPAEFQSLTPASERKAAERDFKLMDFDRSETLSPEEFQAAKGGDVPDPWRKIAEASQETLFKVLRAADADNDRQYSRKEWPARELHAALQPFGEIEFAKWDANADGQVSDAEVQQMVGLAYGLTLPTGEPARWSDGSVLYRSHLSQLDANADGIVTRTEFVNRHWLDNQRNEALFAELDRDADDQLTRAELVAPGSPLRVNLVEKFREIDKNLNGRLDPAELAQHCPPAQNNPRGLKLGLEAFDRDRDGFDLDEFRLSPVGYLYVTTPLLNRKDSNHDGAISWAEFHPVPNPQYAGIAWEVFRRYDRDGDGSLTTDEYDFPDDPQAQHFVHQVTPEVREALKGELRFFLAICPLDAEQKQALKPELASLLSAAARRTATAQRRGIRQMGAPDVQQLVASRLGQFAEQHLPAEAAKSYQEEIAARLAQQQRATVSALVARLDEALLLSEEQRQKISAALVAQWQPAWGQAIVGLIQNDQLTPQVPDECLVPHLSPAQKSIWQRLPNKVAPQNLGRSRFFGDAAENAEPDELADLLPPAAQANDAAAPARMLRIRALEERKARAAEKKDEQKKDDKNEVKKEAK